MDNFSIVCYNLLSPGFKNNRIDERLQWPAPQNRLR